MLVIGFAPDALCSWRNRSICDSDALMIDAAARLAGPIQFHDRVVSKRGERLGSQAVKAINLMLSPIIVPQDERQRTDQLASSEVIDHALRVATDSLNPSRRDPAAEPRFVRTYDQIDASVAYDVTDYATVFIEGTNILDNEYVQTARFDNQLRGYYEYGARFNAGFRLTF